MDNGPGISPISNSKVLSQSALGPSGAKGELIGEGIFAPEKPGLAPSDLMVTWVATCGKQRWWW